MKIALLSVIIGVLVLSSLSLADSNTIALWHFNEGGLARTAIDATGINNASLVGTANYTANARFGSYGIITNTGYLQTGTLWDVMPENSSIEFHFTPSENITGSNSELGLFSKDNTASSEFELIFSSGDTRLRFIMCNAGCVSSYSTAMNWYEGQWYHVAITLNKYDGIKFYVNGTQMGGNSTPVTIPMADGTSSDFYIGIGQSVNVNFTIDELRVSNATRLYDEINYTFNSPYVYNTTREANVYLKGNQQSGEYAIDSSGRRNHVLLNNVTFSQNRLSFANSFTSYFDLPQYALNDIDNLTFQAVINATSCSSICSIIHVSDNQASPTYDVIFYLTSSGELYLTVNLPSNSYSINSASSSIVFGNEYSVKFSITPHGTIKLRLYIDDILQASDSSAGLTDDISNLFDYAEFGRTESAGSGIEFDGFMKEIRISAEGVPEADIIPPSVSISEPTGTYTSLPIPLNYDVYDADLNVSSCFYKIDAGIFYNLPLCLNTTFNTTVGNHTMLVIASDNSLNMGNDTSSFEYITPDTTPPAINLVLPSGSYSTSTIPLNYSVSDDNLNTSACYYQIDSGSLVNIPLCVNTTFISTEGSHTLRLYASDTFGNNANDTNSYSYTEPVNVTETGLSPAVLVIVNIIPIIFAVIIMIAGISMMIYGKGSKDSLINGFVLILVGITLLVVITSLI